MDRLVAFSRRRRRWILLAAVASATAVGAYKIYHHPTVAARRRRLVRLAAAVAAFADAAASSADAAALVASDLADFVRSGSDELPRSVTQLAKLAASPEVSATVSALSEAVTAGILRGAGSSNSGLGSGGSVALSERLVDKLFSDSGERLASAVAGSFARHLVLAFYSVPSPPGEASSPTMWVNVVATGKCRKAISNWVEVFVGTAVREFIDKTIHINTYEQLFEGLTNPKHDAKVKELLVSVCNGAVETLVKTTHHVMSNANDKFDSSGSGSGNGEVGEGWVETVSSTLAVPSNRKFVLDVTGRVTFETVRSFLEFVLWKLQDGARKGGDSVVDSGLQVMRYMSDKSMVIATICITLCLLVLNGTRLLVTA
ncbi:protein PHLOEM PROTEIN 2-LIKE A10-like [Phragmites australis]|uniref:protein PHLOEM PROTEIN 2-LIKE A10-like n=1 Tax=Phragmites australis TaxID=29695 RepID=UPI002D768FEA|nr:protein PHLOEM PROTEIN 2-LIKE A10-like [Phragmites australis]